MSQKTNLKTLLLQPSNTAVAHHLFGTQVYIRRLTVRELIQHDEALTQARDNDDQHAAALTGAKLILTALTTEDGRPIPADELPTAQELLDAHDNVTLFDAIRAIQKHSYGSIEDAEKN